MYRSYVHCSEQLHVQHPSSSGEAGHPSPLLLGRALHRGQPKHPRRRARRRGGLGAGRRHRDRRRLLPADNVPAHTSITAADCQSRQVQAIIVVSIHFSVQILADAHEQMAGAHFAAFSSRRKSSSMLSSSSPPSSENDSSSLHPRTPRLVPLAGSKEASTFVMSWLARWHWLNCASLVVASSTCQ